MKSEFQKVRAVICELADVLDADFSAFVVEEDKSHNFMVLGDKAKPAVIEEGRAPKQEAFLSPHHPFDDELSFNFYMRLPDYSAIIMSVEEV